MTEDDDWFERALREDEDGDDVNAESEEFDDADTESEAPDAEEPEFGDDGDPDVSDDSSATDPSAGELSGDDPSEGDLSGDGPSRDETSEADASEGGFADADPYDVHQTTSDVAHQNPTDSEDADEQSSSSNRTQSDDGTEEDDDDELFDEDFTSAFQNAPGGGGGPEESGDGGSGFGGDGGGGGGFGDGGGGGGGSFGDGGGSDSFGMDSGGGFGGGFGEDDEPFESEEFDDEEFESSIPRIDVGIEGLDSMIQGGVPERSLMTTIGSAGTGKTTFGLQFLHEALVQGENAVFITLEESHDRIVSTATEKGWDFEEYEEEGSLAVIDLDPIEMANSLTSIRNDLPRLVEEFGATRLVLDSVSLLEMMYDDQATRRNEIYDFTKSLKEAGVTTMLTSEASEDSAYASRHGIIEYLVDAVFVLRYIRSSDDFRETRLAVEIQKIRDANHSREIKPYSITNEGISVYRQANIF